MTPPDSIPAIPGVILAVILWLVLGVMVSLAFSRARRRRRRVSDLYVWESLSARARVTLVVERRGSSVLSTSAECHRCGWTAVWIFDPHAAPSTAVSDAQVRAHAHYIRGCPGHVE